MSDVIDVEAREIHSNANIAESASARAPAEEAQVQPVITSETAVAILDPMQAELGKLIEDIKAADFDIATTKGEDECRALRKRCVELRGSADKAYTAWNRPILAAQKAVRERIKHLETAIEPHEKALNDKIQAKEKAREEERLRKVAEEQARMAAIRVQISKIAKLPADAVTLGAAGVDGLILWLQDQVITEDTFGEFVDEGVVLRSETLTQLQGMAEAKREQDRRAAEAEAQAKAAREQIAAAEREARAQREKADHERVLRTKIAKIERTPFGVFGKSAAAIRKAHDELVQPTAEEYGDLWVEATAAWEATRALLAGAALAQDGVEARAAEQAAETARLAAEQKRMADEQQRIDDERAALEAAKPKPEPEIVVHGDLLHTDEAAPRSRADVKEDVQRVLGVTDEIPLSMSMFASVADYEAAVGRVQPVLELEAESHAECDDRLAARLIAATLQKAMDKSELEVLSILLSPDMRAQWAARVDEINANEEIPA